VLWGHSYGGLLIRSYIEDEGRRQRVARVLTVGTPYRGSPKSLFPLAFGVESPTFSALDALINNDRLKLFARNLAGLYNLWPSDRYGPWLTLAGTLQNQAGVASFIGNAGGNPALFEQARGYHNDTYEGFFDDEGKIDTRVVVGAGKLTLDGVSLSDADGGGIFASGAFGNGDKTVPAKSASQRGQGETKPFGDPVHLQYRCRVEHVDLGGDGKVLSAYEAFLDHGEVPRKLDKPGDCIPAGDVWSFTADRIGLAPTLRGARATAPTATLQAAEQQGLVDLIDTADTVLAVTDDSAPVTLQVPIANGSFSVTRWTGEKPGATLSYGPVTGLLTLAPGAPAVKLNGAPLAPNGGGAGGGGGAVSGGGATPPPPPASRPAPKKLALIGRPKLRGRRLKLTVRAPGAGALRVAVTARGRKLGIARLKLKRAGKTVVTVRLKRRAKGKLKVAVTFTPRGGAAQRLTATVRG
jgi:hypothetical protein